MYVCMYVYMYIYVYVYVCIYIYIMSKKWVNFNSRSVELFQPTFYNGYFIKKINPPLIYTRILTTEPLLNHLYMTKKYVSHPTSTENVITSVWSIPPYYPLQGRRQMLI